MLPYEQPGSAAARVANRRVQYTAPHYGARVRYRLGGQGADPDRRGDIGTVTNLRPCTEWENTAMQGRDIVPVATVRLLQASKLWSSPEPGDSMDMSNFPGYKVWKAGAPVSSTR